MLRYIYLATELLPVAANSSRALTHHTRKRIRTIHRSLSSTSAAVGWAASGVKFSGVPNVLPAALLPATLAPAPAPDTDADAEGL